MRKWERFGFLIVILFCIGTLASCERRAWSAPWPLGVDRNSPCGVQVERCYDTGIATCFVHGEGIRAACLKLARDEVEQRCLQNRWPVGAIDGAAGADLQEIVVTPIDPLTGKPTGPPVKQVVPVAKRECVELWLWGFTPATGASPSGSAISLVYDLAAQLAAFPELNVAAKPDGSVTLVMRDGSAVTWYVYEGFARACSRVGYVTFVDCARSICDPNDSASLICR